MADYQRTSWLISSLASSPATVAAADAAGASASMSRRQASAQGENERTSHLNPGFELGCASAGEGTRERGGAKRTGSLQVNWGQRRVRLATGVHPPCADT